MQKRDLENTLEQLNQQLDIYKKENNINELDEANLIKFNDWLENKDQENNNNLAPNYYSSGQTAFEGNYWWGFKIWVTWDALKKFGNIKPSQPLTAGGLLNAFKMLLTKYPALAVTAKVIAIVAVILGAQVVGCLWGRQIWNKKGVVMRFLWIGVMTGCWDQ